jgi:hypothetical protein
VQSLIRLDAEWTGAVVVVGVFPGTVALTTGVPQLPGFDLIRSDVKQCILHPKHVYRSVQPAATYCCRVLLPVQPPCTAAVLCAAVTHATQQAGTAACKQALNDSGVAQMPVAVCCMDAARRLPVVLQCCGAPEVWYDVVYLKGHAQVDQSWCFGRVCRSKGASCIGPPLEPSDAEPLCLDLRVVGCAPHCTIAAA